MKYLRKSFPVPYMGKDYAEGWERTFGIGTDEEFIEKGQGADQGIMREYNGAKLAIKSNYHGYATHSFHVDLVEGDWPSDGDLITLCDGDTPPRSRHFGGRVQKSADGKSAEVDVYVD